MPVDHGHYAVDHYTAPFRRPSLLRRYLRTQPEWLAMARDGATVLAALVLGAEAALAPDHGAFRTQPDCLAVVCQDSFRGSTAVAPEMLRDRTSMFSGDMVAADPCIIPMESDRLNVIGDDGAEPFLFWYASLRSV